MEQDHGYDDALRKEIQARRQHDDIIEELRARGIEILDITPEDVNKLSEDDIRRLEESRLRWRSHDGTKACWYPLQKDERLEEIGRMPTASSAKWRRPARD